MKEKPAYENYPVPEEEMGKRYKNWLDMLGRQVLIMYRVGKELAGDQFIERLKEEYYKDGQKGAHKWMVATGTKLDDFQDCMALAKVQDAIDDTLANFWDGYVEHTPQAFEKELKTCPMTRMWSREPEICEILVASSLKGMIAELNPKFKSDGFTKLLPKGDPCCRFRVTLEE